MDLPHWLGRSTQAVEEWSADFGPTPEHPVRWIDDETFEAAFTELGGRLRRGRPVFHPRFLAAPVQPVHPAALVGHVAAALAGEDAHPELAEEILAQLSAMLGIPAAAGRLAVSSTAANLDALCLWRDARPGLGIAYSADSEAVFGRLCRVLGVPSRPVAVDDVGRIDVAALDDVLRGGGIGTVALSAGTATTGAVDPIHEVVQLCERHSVRVHVDASYGGFFALVAGEESVRPEPWAALGACDSVVVDPRRHAMQPAGCAAVLFTDPAVKSRLAAHADPPAGASVAALWLTFQLLPPTRDGLGRLIAVTRRAANRWAALIRRSPQLRLHQPPDLDVILCLPAVRRMSYLDVATARVVRRGAGTISDPVYLGTSRVGRARLGARHPGLELDAVDARVLRAVLLKPETAGYVEILHRRVESLAAEARRTEANGGPEGRDGGTWT